MSNPESNEDKLNPRTSEVGGNEEDVVVEKLPFIEARARVLGNLPPKELIDLVATQVAYIHHYRKILNNISALIDQRHNVDLGEIPSSSDQPPTNIKSD